jgi:hypothetical protein
MNNKSENDPNRVQYTRYQVYSYGYQCKIGDIVQPGMTIGLHYKTRQPVKANFNGKIATKYYNPMYDSYMIMVVSDNSPAEMAVSAAID